jgi:hypothetical protein
MMLAATGRSSAQFCLSLDAKRVADEIARMFNDLSVENAMICNVSGSGDQCELVCSSPQRISTADQRNDVLPLLTAVAGIAMRAIGRSDFSAITFMDNRLAEQGRSLHLPASRVMQLYASLDDGTVNADAFRANVAKEFKEKNDATVTGAVQEPVVVAVLPRPRPQDIGIDAVHTAPAITVIPRPRPQIDAKPADDWRTAALAKAGPVHFGETSEIPLPRSRPRPRVARPRAKAPGAPSPVPVQQ